MKNKTKIIGSIVIFLAVTILLFLNNTTPVIDKTQIKTVSFIDYPEKFNYRQTINDCGPFNTAAIVRALKNEEIDSPKFAEKIQWRLPNGYTLPWGLEKQLKENDIIVETPNLREFSNEEKILFLQEQISLGKPVIILGGKYSYQHYTTVFGFDSSKNEFYVYDSMRKENPDIEGLTTDENGDFPGNGTITSTKLLDFWKDGGMFGLYKWYAIVASI